MKVIFRRYPEGDIVAWLPDVIARPGHCMSYQSQGQHCEGIYDTTMQTVSSQNYNPLLKELKAIGYINLMPSEFFNVQEQEDALRSYHKDHSKEATIGCLLDEVEFGTSPEGILVAPFLAKAALELLRELLISK